MPGELINAAIAGIGTYVPGQVLTNTEIEKITGASDEWIRSRTAWLKCFWTVACDFPQAFPSSIEEVILVNTVKKMWESLKNFLFRGKNK